MDFLEPTEVVKFDEKLYLINLEENEFTDGDKDGRSEEDKHE